MDVFVIPTASISNGCLSIENKHYTLNKTFNSYHRFIPMYYSSDGELKFRVHQHQ